MQNDDTVFPILPLCLLDTLVIMLIYVTYCIFMHFFAPLLQRHLWEETNFSGCAPLVQSDCTGSSSPQGNKQHKSFQSTFKEDMRGTFWCYLLNHSNLIPLPLLRVRDNKGNNLCWDCSGGKPKNKIKITVWPVRLIQLTMTCWLWLNAVRLKKHNWFSSSLSLSHTKKIPEVGFSFGTSK